MSLTHELLRNKKELRHYMGELGYKENMVLQAEEKLSLERKASIKLKVECTTKMMEGLESTLVFRDEIDDLKIEYHKYKQLNQIKLKVSKQDQLETGRTRYSETAKKNKEREK